MKNFHLSVLLGVLLLVMSTGVGWAQDAEGEPQATPRPTPTPSNPATSEEGLGEADNGSIRGAVYRDSDNDGVCPEEGDTAVAGVPIRFVSNDGATTVYLQSGADGTYGLVAAGYGTWQVTADPAADQGVVTSAKTREVFIGEDEPLALGASFCIGTTAAVQGAGSAPIVLPQSGAPAPVANVLPITAGLAVAGLLFIGAGLVQYRREQ